MPDIHFTEKVLKYPKTVIALTLLVVAFTFMGLPKIKAESDGRIFFGPGNPMLKALDDFERTFNRENGIFFAIERKDGKDIFQNDTLALIKELTKESWQMPYSSRADSVTNFQHTEVKGDELIIDDLVNKNPSDLTGDDLHFIKQVALTDPLLLDSFVSRDGKVASVVSLGYVPDDNANYVLDMSAFAYKKVDELTLKYPGHNIYVTGGAAFDDAFAEQNKIGLTELTPKMLLVMIVLIYLFLHSFTAVFSIILVMLFSAITAMGISGWLGIALSGPSSMAPMIIFTLAVADSIHVLSNMFREMVFEGRSKHDALLHSMKINFKPIFITSITTAIGFLSMNFSDAPPFHDLGNITAIGVMAAFVYSIAFLPAFVSLLPAHPSKKGLYSKKLTDSLADFVIKHENRIFYPGIIITTALIFGMTMLTFDDDFVEYFNKDNRVRVATEYVEKKLIGLDVIEYSIKAGGENSINDPQYLRSLEKFVNFWLAKPEVKDVASVIDIYKRLNRTMNEGNNEYYKLPESRELAAQYLLMYELGLPVGMDLNRRINQAHDTTRITVYVDATSARIRELAMEGDEWLKNNIDEKYFTPATGLSLLFAYISKRNIEAMLTGTIVALALISIILIIALKSVKLGTLSLIPNLVPPFCAFGLWGYTFGEVGLAVAVVTAISIGIVVDDTVHLLSKYMDYRTSHKEAESEGDAIRFAFNRSGNAIIITSIAIGIGFGIMGLSGFKVNITMGVLTAAAVFFALIADLLFLPTILMKFYRKN